VTLCKTVINSRP